MGMKPNYGMYDMMNSQEHMRFSQQLWEDRDSYNQNILPIGYAGLIQKLQKKEITRQQFEQEYRKMERMKRIGLIFYSGIVLAMPIMSVSPLKGKKFQVVSPWELTVLGARRKGMI